MFRIMYSYSTCAKSALNIEVGFILVELHLTINSISLFVAFTKSLIILPLMLYVNAVLVVVNVIGVRLTQLLLDRFHAPIYSITSQLYPSVVLFPIHVKFIQVI